MAEISETVFASGSADWWGPNGRVWTTTHYYPLTDWGARLSVEMPVLNSLLGQLSQSILDAPTGFGRHALELAKNGHRVTGIDINPSLLGIATNEAQRQNLGTRVSFAETNMLSPLPFKVEQFDCVVNLFSSFGYTYDRLDDLNLLREFSRVVKSGGQIIFDLPNPYGKLSHFQNSWHSTIGSEIAVDHEAVYDPVENMIHERRTYIYRNGATEIGALHMRLYEPHELIELGRRLGLCLRCLLSKDGSDFVPSTGRYWLSFLKGGRLSG